jgi:hypothetical protein
MPNLDAQFEKYLLRRCSPNKKPPTWRAFAKRLKGLEPSTFCMASRRSSQLSYSRGAQASIDAGASAAATRSAARPLLADPDGDVAAGALAPRRARTGHNARNDPGRMQLRRYCLVLLAGALLAAGCGSKAKTVSQTTATTASTPTASTPTSSTTTTPAAATDCNTLGINPTGMREGTCTHAGTTYVIVDENHTLKLRTLSVKLVKIRTPSTLTGSKSATAQGRFIVASLTIDNRLELPQIFDAAGTQQAGLILDGTVYKEDAAAENGSDSASCLSQSMRIPAGQSETCDVIFDVPASSAADLGKHGSGDLYIVDFGSDLAGGTPPQTVGQIRLYH